uniref:Putative ovule protein n=1 Tax=Solanum chacoense TaxID=4108 RepID=A0A0V0GQ49_SOLCH
MFLYVFYLWYATCIQASLGQELMNSFTLSKKQKSTRESVRKLQAFGNLKYFKISHLSLHWHTTLEQD